MKATAIAISTILAASLAMAAETTAQPTTTAKDSPLVRAAKTTDRSKKHIVITNESLKGSTGHVTTTKMQPPVYQPPVVQMSQQEYQAQHPVPVQPKADKGDEKKGASAEAAKKARMERLAAEQEEGPYSDVDPAMLEQQLDKNTQQAPKQEQKKP